MVLFVIYQNIFNYLLNLISIDIFGLQIATTSSATQIVATTTVTMQPFGRNVSAKSVIETKPSSCIFPTPSAPPISGTILLKLLIPLYLYYNYQNYLCRTMVKCSKFVF